MSPNPVIQLAAALDRRRMSVRIEHESVGVWIQDDEYIVIKRADLGSAWRWAYGGKSRSCAVDDWEAMADSMAKFIAEEPRLAATAARFRLGIEEAEVQRQAAGLSREQVLGHTRRARAAFTVTTPGRGPEAAAVYRARARWMEWERIGTLLDGAHMPVYDPERDPGSIGTGGLR